MNDRQFPRFDEHTAPPAARDALAGAKLRFGAVPEPLACYAGAPAVLAAALGGLAAFENTSLTPLEREVLAMTMGHAHGCQFCLALHRRLLAAQGAPADIVSALDTASPLPDGRLEALRQFVLSLLETHGNVARDVWLDFRQAGFDHAQALEVTMGVSVYTLTTLANRLTETSE